MRCINSHERLSGFRTHLDVWSRLGRIRGRNSLRRHSRFEHHIRNFSNSHARLGWICCWNALWYPSRFEHHIRYFSNSHERLGRFRTHLDVWSRVGWIRGRNSLRRHRRFKHHIRVHHVSYNSIIRSKRWIWRGVFYCVYPHRWRYDVYRCLSIYYSRDRQSVSRISWLCGHSILARAGGNRFAHIGCNGWNDRKCNLRSSHNIRHVWPSNHCVSRDY